MQRTTTPTLLDRILYDAANTVPGQWASREDEYRETIDLFRTKLSSLYRLAAEVERVGGITHRYCPWCGATKPDHAPSCRYVELVPEQYWEKR